MIAGLRGMVAAGFASLSAIAMFLWIVTAPQLRALGRAIVLDPQLVMVLGAGIVALAALLVSWSAFGRAMVASAGLVLAGQGALVTVMSMGGLVVTGRPGPPTPVSVWPIMAAMLGLAAVVLGLWRSPDEVVIGRRQLVGSWTAALLAIAAVGVPTMSVAVAGAAPTPIMTTAGRYVAQAVTGLVVVLVATAGLRARRWAALGQAVAAVAIMAAGMWLPAVVPGVSVDTRPKQVAVGLVALALVTWGLTAGGGSWDDEWADDEWGADDEWAERDPRGRPRSPDGERGPSRQQDPRVLTAVLEPAEPGGVSSGGSRTRGGAATEVVRDRDQTEVVDAVDDPDPTIRLDE